MSPWPERTTRFAALATVFLLAGCSSLATPGPDRDRRAFHGPLRTTSIALPADEARFTAPGADMLERNCLACHSATMISHQPRLTATQWRMSCERCGMPITHRSQTRTYRKSYSVLPR